VAIGGRARLPVTAVRLRAYHPTSRLDRTRLTASCRFAREAVRMFCERAEARPRLSRSRVFSRTQSGLGEVGPRAGGLIGPGMRRRSSFVSDLVSIRGDRACAISRGSS
jgi:hypothetical protein